MKSVNTDVAYDYIRKRILSGEFAPGHPLMTEILSKEIKVSRTPVRDALRKLETDGLVTIRAHIGASVKKMNLREFREMSDLRLALESHAAGLAAINRTDTDLVTIKYALEAMRVLTDKIIAADKEQPWLNDLMREDIRFHIAIMAAAKNELMKREIMRLHLLHRVVSGLTNVEAAMTPKTESDSRRRVVLAKHEDIYNAIASSNAPLAKQEMEFHLQELIDHNFHMLARADAGVITRDLTAEELLYSSQR